MGESIFQNKNLNPQTLRPTYPPPVPHLYHLIKTGFVQPNPVYYAFETRVFSFVSSLKKMTCAFLATETINKLLELNIFKA